MEATVGGNVILARRQFVLDKGGQPLWEQVLAQLPAADAAQLKRVLLLTSAYSLALNVRLDDAIARTLYPGDEKRAFLEMGRTSAQLSLTGAQRAFVRDGDPHHLLGFTEMIYAFYYGQGRRTYERTADTGATLTTYDAPPSTPGDCLTVLGWYERALELSGARDVAVSESRCRNRGDSVCEYKLTWR